MNILIGSEMKPIWVQTKDQQMRLRTTTQVTHIPNDNAFLL